MDSLYLRQQRGRVGDDRTIPAETQIGYTRYWMGKWSSLSKLDFERLERFLRTKHFAPKFVCCSLRVK